MYLKKGYSLLELLLVLGIVSALVVSAFIIYPKVRAYSNSKTEASNANTINAGIKELYAGKSSYSGLNNTTAINAGIVPVNMLKDGDIVTSFGGKVNIVGLNLTNNTSVYYIAYSNVPPDVCIGMLNIMKGGFDQIYISHQKIVGSDGSVDLERGIADCNSFQSVSLTFLVGNTTQTLLI